jgi:hypothetical protein
MNETVHKETFCERLAQRKVQIMGLAGSVFLVASASALPLNMSVNEILVAVQGIFPSIVDLVVGILPLMVVLAVIGMIVGIIDAVLAKVRV